MTRSINPVPQYQQGGEPLANAKMYFFDTNSNTPKTTFADASETTANTHPLILDAEGRLPNCFFSGLAKQILTDENDVQIFNRDPVGQELAISAFDTFDTSTSYQINAIVTTSDGRFFKSLISGNIGFNPVTDDSTHWQEISFSDFYAAGVTFGVNDKAISTVDGLSYISGVTPNKGNEPSANLDKWALDRPSLPYVSGKTYSAGEKAIDPTDKREYSAVIANSGNPPITDDGSNWLPTDGKITKPVNTVPSDTATGISRMPTLTTSAYAVTGAVPAFEWAQYQVTKVSTGDLAYDSGIVRDTPSHIVTNQLEAAVEYSFQVFQKGVRTDVSTASTATTFTTTLNLGEAFDTVTFIGTGAALGVTTEPNLTTDGIVFIDNVDLNSGMRICDSSALRGVGKAYILGTNSLETAEANGVTSFNATGYTVGTDVNYNTLGDDIYSFVLKKTAGVCDIVNYSGNAVNRTVSHSLGTDVGMMICRQQSGTNPVSTPWTVTWINGMTNSQFNSIGQNTVTSTSSVMWDSTLPTSSVFSLGTDDRVNGSAAGSREYTMYLFANNPAAGIKCGTYEGTGAALKITTGFPVSTFITSDGDNNKNWLIHDKKLGLNDHIQLDANARITGGGPLSFDSDGITLNTNADENTSGDTYFYIAIADPEQF